jgi:hypothetical protein
MTATHVVTYRIVETLDPRRPDERWFEVWGGNATTGYEWLIAEYDTREQARAMIQHWQEAVA